MSSQEYYAGSRFVSDSPPGDDEFPSGAHARVADTLVRIVTSSEGGRAIGLEGTWGSGKSTVVDFVLNQIKNWNESNSPKRFVFVFDAWAHQGDPTRRVFLEELISELAASGKKIIDRGVWNHELEKLRSKRKQTTETKAERLSWVARLTLVALPLYPAGYALIVFGLGATAPSFVMPSFLGGFNVSYYLAAGIAIIAAPYVAALCTWVSWRRGLPFRTAKWYLPKDGKEGRSVIWAFNRQTDHVTVDQLIKEDEATTIEFNAVFDKLIEEARINDHRVVIVLDNLDRLSDEQIRDVWAIMRNFFASTPGSKRRSILAHVWLVVPIDRNHIETVFGKGTSQGDRTTRGFIEKTFEIVLRVPPPLTSNWRLFLERQLAFAFGDKIQKSEIYAIFRFYDLYRVANPTVITPRAIKAYVNGIVAQAHLSGDAIPIEYQALYVLYKDKISSDVSKLQDSSVLDEAVLVSATDKKWTTYLAAAHFNVHPDVALEVLLGPEIEKTLLEGDAGRLNDLSKTNGFELILNSLVTSKANLWAQENPGNFFDIAATLQHVNFVDVGAQSHIWRDLNSKIGLIFSPVVPGRACELGIKAILENSPKIAKANAATGIIRALKLPRTDLPANASEHGSEWFSLIETAAKEVRDSISEEEFKAIFSNISVPSNVQFLIGFAISANESKILDLSKFTTPHSLQQIATQIVAIVNANPPGETLEQIVASFLKNPEVVDWSIVVAAIQERLSQADRKLESATALRFLTLLRSVALTQEAAKNSLKKLDEEGVLHSLLLLARNENNIQLSASAVYEIMAQRDGEIAGPAEHPSIGSLQAANEYLASIQAKPENDNEILEGIARIAVQEGRFWHFLRLSLPADKNRNIYRSLLKPLVLNDGVNRLVVSDVLTKYDRISEILGNDLEKMFLERFDAFEIDEEISGEKWTAIQPQFLIASKPLRTDHFRTGIRAVQNGLSRLTTQEWIEALEKESNALRLLFTLIELDEAKTFDTSFYDALRTHAHKVIDGEIVPKRYFASWHALPQRLSSSSQRNFYKDLRDQLVNKAADADTIVRTLTLFGTEFTEKGDFSQRHDVVRTIIEPLVADAKETSLSTLEEHSGSFARTIRKAAVPDRQFLVDRFVTVLAGSDAERKLRLEGLLDSLDIEIPKVEEKNSTPNEPAEETK